MSTRFDELKIANQLPSPSGVVLAILRLGESDDASMIELARIAQTDPALCGRLLKIANSTSMACGRPAASVNDALSRLGIRMVRSVALGFSLVSRNSRGRCAGFDYDRFWSHSLAMGIAAQAVAQRLGRIAPHEAFTCGLLAQIGRLALAGLYPEIYGELLSQVTGSEADELEVLERKRFAIDHHELTGALLRDWGIIEEFAMAAERFHRSHSALAPGNERVAALSSRLLRLAARIADACLSAGAESSAQTQELVSASDAVGIDSTRLAEICEGVARDWHEWGAIFDVKTAAPPAFAEMIERVHAAAQVVGEPSPEGEPYSKADALADAPLRIVAIDNDPIGLRVLTAQLVKAGHCVRTATDGDEGLRRILAEDPHLVITDQEMPRMDGMTLTRTLRQTKAGRQLYVIVLTANNDDKAQVEAFDAGADDYIAKPFRPALLAARIRACARVVGLQAEVQRERQELRRCMGELSVANRKLQQAAHIDVLTGLHNRRFAMEHLERSWNESIRTRAPLTCMLVDIDHFKRVNDAYGHDVGDRVLRATAELLCSKMRSTDVVCRVGGEEFLVIGADMDQDSASACAERLRAGAQAQVIETADRHLRVTVSIGVAIRTDATRRFEELLKIADRALYTAKAMGRNQVRFESTSEAEAHATQ